MNYVHIPKPVFDAVRGQLPELNIRRSGPDEWLEMDGIALYSPGGDATIPLVTSGDIRDGSPVTIRDGVVYALPTGELKPPA